MTQRDRQEMLPVNYNLMAPGLHQASRPHTISEATMLDLLQQVFDRLEQPEDVDLSSDEQLMSSLHLIMLDPAQFVAGNPASRIHGD